MGVAVFVLAVLAGFFFFYNRRQKHRQLPKTVNSDRSLNKEPLRQKDMDDSGPIHEMQSSEYQNYYEMNSEVSPSELPGSENVVHQQYRPYRPPM